MAADLKNEIDALRSQIEALTKQIPTADAARAAQTDLLGGAHLGQFGIDSETIDKIKDQFDGFVDLLEKHLQEIPAGTTQTYGEVAQRIGAPQLAKEVGEACAANPLAVAVPCHRVVRKDGGLAGYRWGVKRKRALLEREGARLAETAGLFESH